MTPPLPRAVAANERDATWSEAFRSSHAALIAYARRRVPSQQVAEDVVSETFTRALARSDSFDPERANIGTWLRGILHNVIHEQHRSQQRAHRLVELQHSESRTRAGPEEAHQAVVETEVVIELRDAFAQLGRVDRELLHLRVVVGLRPQEIAAHLGTTPGAVRTAQSRALARLRTALRAPRRHDDERGLDDPAA